MCMASFFPANVEIDIDGLSNGSITNDDGHGWAVASKSKGLEIGKSMKFSEALTGVLRARLDHGPDSLVLFHSRFATHGTVNEFNVHPFYVGDDEQTVMAHNGILPAYWQPELGDKRSDTRIFADMTAPFYMTPTGVPSRRGAKEIGRRIGAYNKLVFLSVKSGVPKVRIVNASSGQHSGGAWYSNDGYCPRRYTYKPGLWTPGTYTGRYGSMWPPYADDDSFLDKEETKALVVYNGGRSAYREEDGKSYYGHECDCCGAVGMINVDTDTCEACGVCLDCWNDEEQCSCKWRKWAREQEESEYEAAQHAIDEDNIWTEQEIAAGAWLAE